jgi:hypothetical protein
MSWFEAYLCALLTCGAEMFVYGYDVHEELVCVWVEFLF